MSVIHLKRFLVILVTLAGSLSFLPQLMATEGKPLVALLNEKIQTQDSVVVVEKVVIHPDESSIYEPGEENYGMPVTEEYGKGPVVILRIEKQPGHPWNIPFDDDWIQVELFSDGKKLSGTNSGEIGKNRRVFGFSFWAAVDMSVSPEGAIELRELGEVELKVTISRIVKVFDIPISGLPLGKAPIFEDEDVQIWEVRWNKDFTSLRIRFKSKTELVSYNLAWLGEKNYIVGAVGDISSWKEYHRSLPKSEFTGAQFWKCIKLTRKTMSPLKFLPQRSEALDKMDIPREKEKQPTEDINIPDDLGEL